MNTFSDIFKKNSALQLEDEFERLFCAGQASETRERKFTRLDETKQIHMISTDLIFPNPSQPRSKFEDDGIIRLADSIRHYGILQPITVRRIDGTGIQNALFEVIAGERRLRAAKILSLKEVPCIILNVDSKKSTELAIIENIQRENLNLFEQANAIASLIDIYGLTQEEVARRLSMSQSYIANKLRILRLTSREREKILKYGLTERHARALLRISSAEERLKIIEYINAHSLNVASTESYVDRFLAENESAKKARSPRKIVLKDIRVFYNSVERAISVVKQAGINVESERIDEPGTTIITIRVPTGNVSRET